MKKNSILYLILILLVSSISLSSCHQGQGRHHKGDIKILRFDQVMFDTPVKDLQSKLTQEQQHFNCTLLPVDPTNPSYVNQVAAFVQDPVMREIYDTVQTHFGNLSGLEHDLTLSLNRLKKAFDDTATESGKRLQYNKFIAFVSGSLDYEYRTAAYEGTLLISLDQYVMPYMKKYSYFGLPMYLVNMSDSSFLLTDCVSAIAKQAVPLGKMNQMLDYMMAAGKTLYLLDIAMPKADDRIKIRYSENQMKWMRQNEANVWAYFVQQKLLFENDYNKYHNFIDEAPKTNAFQESAPRTAEYIGWQIVRQYVKKTGCTPQELLDETNSMTLLQKSGYRP